MQHIIEFLKVYIDNISGNALLLSDPVFNEFFAEVLNREMSAHLCSYLVDFLWIIGRKYQEANRPVEFVIELFKFESGGLLSSMCLLRSAWGCYK